MSQQGGQEGLQAGAVEDSDDNENIEYGLLQTRWATPIQYRDSS